MVLLANLLWDRAIYIIALSELDGLSCHIDMMFLHGYIPAFRPGSRQGNVHHLHD